MVKWHHGKHEERSFSRPLLVNNFCVQEKCWEHISTLYGLKLFGTCAPDRWCQDVCTVNVSQIDVPLKLLNAEGDEIQLEYGVAILWPWEFISCLYENGQLERWVSENPREAHDRCEQYWKHSEGQEFFSQLGLQPESYRTCAPLYFHTDAAKIYRNQKLWIYSCTSACHKGDISTMSKLVIIVLRDAMIVKDASHDRVGETMAYICATLASGRWPQHDHRGNPFPTGSREYNRAGRYFANGWTCHFAGFKSDWEARAVVHKSTRWYACNFICDHCLASRDPRWTFGDFRVNHAECLKVRFTHSQYMVLQGRRQSSWRFVKGWTKDRNLEDLCLHFNDVFL